MKTKMTLIVGSIVIGQSSAWAGPKPKRVISTDFSKDEPAKPTERDPNATVLNIKESAKPTYRPDDEYDEVRMITKTNRKPASPSAKQTSTRREPVED